MEWIKLYPQGKQPSPGEITEYIASPLWADLNRFLQESYETAPSYSYSACSGQPGWNVKYQKAGRSLCTLYPMKGFFIALVVIGSKEQGEAELLLPALDAHIQNLYQNADVVMGGRWLMIGVTSEQILANVKDLIQLRRKIKRRASHGKSHNKN